MGIGDVKRAAYPNVTVAPLLLFIVPFVASVILHFPLSFGLPLGDAIRVVFALIFLVFGTFLFMWSFQSFRIHQENIRLRTPAEQLLTEGPFRFSRNPTYVAFILLYFGLTLMLNSWWPIIFSPVVLVLLYQKVIIPEEEYLEKTFGDVYRSYKGRVRRFL